MEYDHERHCCHHDSDLGALRSFPSRLVWGTHGAGALLASAGRAGGCERVRFARRRFGRYKVIDFMAVLFGYAERR